MCISKREGIEGCFLGDIQYFQGNINKQNNQAIAVMCTVLLNGCVLVVLCVFHHKEYVWNAEGIRELFLWYTVFLGVCTFRMFQL